MARAHRLWIVWIAALAVLAAPRAEALSMFVPIGGAGYQATAVTGDGSTVVGHYSTPFGQVAFRWREATGVEPYPFDAPTDPDLTFARHANAVTDDGETVGGVVHVFGDPERPMRCSATACIPTNAPLGQFDYFGSVFAMSSDGSHAAGESYYEVDPIAPALVATRWGPDGAPILLHTPTLADTNGTDLASRALGMSDDGSVITGWAFQGGPSQQEAFVWTAATGLVSLGNPDGGANSSSGRAVSGDGSVVVGASVGFGAFRWTVAEGMVDLGDLPGGTTASSALAVSHDGSVIGGLTNTSGVLAAFIWDAVNGMRDLQEVLTQQGVDVTGWQLTRVTGISADGRTLVGNGINPSGQAQAWLAVLPEPRLGLLVALALVAFAARGLRRP